MKNILLFGAGKSASVLIDFLIELAPAQDWHITIIDANQKLIEDKIGGRPRTVALALDVNDAESRQNIIKKADIVISLMPPALHLLIARDCLQFGKHLLTASYADSEIKALSDDAKAKGILFLCEMGLDPGIDHMSAMELIERIRKKGGHIHSFKSHCGGLVAPESDNNPWHYKISWNPRNVVLAGKQGAIYKWNGTIIEEPYETLFDRTDVIPINESDVEALGYYPNRNSLPYIQLYGLNEVETFVRTTLRYPSFMSGWKNIVALKLTDENNVFDCKGKSLRDFFSDYLKMNNTMAAKMESIYSDRDDSFRKQFEYLGSRDNITRIEKEKVSPADVLQQALEQKLALGPDDKDMVVMVHEIEYTINNQKRYTRSLLLVKGKDSVHTAMAKTVGLPLGIAAKLILENKIEITGVQIPIRPEIYLPVLKELEAYGISFKETDMAL